jgi:hypothetical protein
MIIKVKHFKSLNPVPPAFFPSHPNKTYQINEEQDLQITCSAIGPPTPNVTWVRITNGHVATKSQGSGSAVLNINNIKRHESGTYECQARNNPNEGSTSTQTNVIVNCEYTKITAYMKIN